MLSTATCHNECTNSQDACLLSAFIILFLVKEAKTALGLSLGPDLRASRGPQE